MGVISIPYKMEELLLRFPHIGTKIFEELDCESVTVCRTVITSWKSFIDDQKFLWIRKIRTYIQKSKESLKNVLKFINIEDVKEIAGFARTAEGFLQKTSSILHFSAMTGNTNVFRAIFEKSNEKFPKDNNKRTPFHYAAENGCLEICQDMIENLK